MLVSPSSSEITIIWLDARACLSEALDRLEMDKLGLEKALSLKSKYQDRLADWQVSKPGRRSGRRNARSPTSRRWRYEQCLSGNQHTGIFQLEGRPEAISRQSPKSTDH